MSWRTSVRRTRERSRNTLANGQQWGARQQPDTISAPAEVIGMHVRVLRYHEIRLGNIEKQLSNLSKQLSNLGKNPKIQRPTSSGGASDNTVDQLQDILMNLAAEVSSSNKIIKQFITGDKTEYKSVPIQEIMMGKDESVEKNEALEKKIPLEKNIPLEISEKDTMEWRLAKTRLISCGIRAPDDRIRDMMKTMQEEMALLTAATVEPIEPVETVGTIKTIEIIKNVEEKESLEETPIIENIICVPNLKGSIDTDSSDEETIDISTTKDIGYVPVHVVVKKKKRGRPKKKTTAI
jgi:hypothetical protein